MVFHGFWISHIPADRFAAFWSMTAHYIDTPFLNIWVVGSILHGGVYLTPKLEFFGQFEYGWWDFDGNSLADLTLVTFGANYYIDGHDLKWTTDIGVGISKIETPWAANIAGYRGEPDDAEPQVVFRTQLQLVF